MRLLSIMQTQPGQNHYSAGCRARVGSDLNAQPAQTVTSEARQSGTMTYHAVSAMR